MLVSECLPGWRINQAQARTSCWISSALADFRGFALKAETLDSILRIQIS